MTGTQPLMHSASGQPTLPHYSPYIPPHLMGHGQWPNPSPYGAGGPYQFQGTTPGMPPYNSGAWQHHWVPEASVPQQQSHPAQVSGMPPPYHPPQSQEGVQPPQSQVGVQPPPIPPSGGMPPGNAPPPGGSMQPRPPVLPPYGQQPPLNYPPAPQPHHQYSYQPPPYGGQQPGYAPYGGHNPGYGPNNGPYGYGPYQGTAEQDEIGRELDRILGPPGQVVRTPFVWWIAQTPLREKKIPDNLPTYDGTTDPRDFFTDFRE